METRVKELKFERFIWIDICQPDRSNLDKIAKEFNLDFFQIKDSLETGHLPKFETQDNYSFLILRAYTANIDERVTNVTDLSNKVAFFYSDKKVITIHRANFEFLENISKNFSSSEEFLLYILHKMMETYNAPLKLLSDKNDEIEKTIFLKDYSVISLEDLYFQKTQTRIIKKLLQITQNVVNQIDVAEQTKTALQDIKDKLLSLTLSYEEVLENSNNLLNTYLSVNAQKSNDVMKLLTIFSAFFLPLTFIAGIYGMNFENMPELRWHLGYFFTMGVMVIIAVIIFYWFKRKKIL
ncbi:CorA family divalent cation transporter [Arcicella sp. LKC2W]|uniref:CorA family divalent cation transporter n=1 Tax=Arcicella sp. LKC2W TaxID=2984198 RepID=UPI002B211D88|nr:CorA family divalent cation transporter [Arcicella sp. LKC2W]MEA5460900.1 CorA family divalent cation transporter [Arcicella sp. LKC2W]